MRLKNRRPRGVCLRGVVAAVAAVIVVAGSAATATATATAAAAAGAVPADIVSLAPADAERCLVVDPATTRIMPASQFENQAGQLAWGDDARAQPALGAAAAGGGDIPAQPVPAPSEEPRPRLAPEEAGRPIPAPEQSEFVTVKVYAKVEFFKHNELYPVAYTAQVTSINGGTPADPASTSGTKGINEHGNLHMYVGSFPVRKCTTVEFAISGTYAFLDSQDSGPFDGTAKIYAGTKDVSVTLTLEPK